MKTDASALLAAQKSFFNSGNTLSLSFRKEMLQKLYCGIREREEIFAAALQSDLGKGAFEGYMCETGFALSEISYLLKHFETFAKPRRVKTPLSQFPAKSRVYPSPRGNILIMSPWNYPVLLTLSPLADAIAAGNTAIVKPSAYAPACSKAVADLIGSIFPAEYVAVVEGGRMENQALLLQKFDFIFFTGSSHVGKEVLRHAAEHLTPAVLELGGKSPTIVDATANIPLAAKRIVFGKFLNCGQTCVAPDYILSDVSVKDALVTALKKEILLQYGENPLENPAYGHMVSEKHFDRVRHLIEETKVVHGGEVKGETWQIAPTLMDHVTEEDRVMGEEIFGPLLPILTYKSFDEVYAFLRERPSPLALYLFSEDRKRQKEVLSRLRFGGGCINDTVVHLATPYMGFGGVGESGMGAYHGKVGFFTFSHQKSVLQKSTAVDVPLRYSPYSMKRLPFLRRFLH